MGWMVRVTPSYPLSWTWWSRLPNTVGETGFNPRKAGLSPPYHARRTPHAVALGGVSGWSG